jgi:hypothetical protein
MKDSMTDVATTTLVGDEVMSPAYERAPKVRTRRA